MEEEFSINGTLIWYFCICPRETWLMAHQLTPDEHDVNIELGRLIHREHYSRDRKEVELPGVSFDVVRRQGEQIVIGEIKKSSKYLDAARMQLLFYLEYLHNAGIQAEGELLVPEEKRKERVVLDDERRKELARLIKQIDELVHLATPPPAKRLFWCRNCAYAEFCWS